MELKDFKYHCKEKKIELLFSDGIFLASRRDGDNTLFLFQVHDFYVEVYFYDDCSGPGYMRAFTETFFLEPYLENIDISPLLQSEFFLN